MNKTEKPASPPAILRIPPTALVVLVGPAAAGKSTWAARHFKPTQIVSSDHCRALIADDESDQDASRDAFRIFHRIISERLKRGLLTVADSTALQPMARADLLRCANIYGRPTIAVLFIPTADTQRKWNAQRSRNVPNPVLMDHRQLAQQALQAVCSEGFSQITVLRTPEEIDELEVRVGAFYFEQDHGPFDIIGDVHGCYDELVQLLTQLGYTMQGGSWSHPAKRIAVFVGDVADRGPGSVPVWQLILGMLEMGNALLVTGNHDNKLMRWLLGRPIRAGRGLQGTIEEIERLPQPQQMRLCEQMLAAIRSAPGYLLLDEGKIVVTHAGIRDEMIGRWDRQIEAYCLYGEVIGYDDNGSPIRRSWSLERQLTPTSPLIVYGHVVVKEPEFIHETIDIDTGCCFGGALTALRYPERTLVSVPAARAYSEWNEP